MEKRFKKVYSESTFMQQIEVIVDTATGVNYLYRSSGYGGGLTPLLGADGKPIVMPDYIE